MDNDTFDTAARVWSEVTSEIVRNMIWVTCVAHEQLERHNEVINKLQPNEEFGKTIIEYIDKRFEPDRPDKAAENARLVLLFVRNQTESYLGVNK